MGGVLGQGDVADVVERRDTPVARVQSAWVARAGCAAVRLVTAQTVMVRQRRLPRDRTRRVLRLRRAARRRRVPTGDPPSPATPV